MYRVDSAFTKGSTHVVCQDYTTHGIYKNSYPYIILADGCSTAPKSEFGAQLLVRSAELSIMTFIDQILSGWEWSDMNDAKQRFELTISRKLIAVAESLELDYMTLSATLMLAFVVDGKLFIYSRGDGMIATKFTDRNAAPHEVVDITRVRRVSYTTNAPYYIAYDINPNKKREYERQFGNGKIEVIDTLMGIDHTEILPYDSCVFDVHHVDAMGLNINYVILSSDGIESYKPSKLHTDPHNVHIPFESIFNRVSSFKNSAGVFVTRRLGVMEIEDKKNMIEHTDDVSIAAIIEVPDVQS